MEILNAIIGAKQGHKIILNYLNYIKFVYSMKDEQSIFHYSKCAQHSNGLTMYGTGPMIFAAIVYNHINTDDNQDILISQNFSETIEMPIKIKNQDGNIHKKTIKFFGYDCYSSSWLNNYRDIQTFGWIINDQNSK
ncbi:UNKNOWN [Stylonychia lemnae]|uniref:Uncharacterized protein n=1 Tax=Stylonychia lemnae TaxID=5949 RepID=A0A078ADW5_STYLE|nr:UNKNOWN [Stylonychia lemnae]|eukprot:CDW79103.1 UNKNOWN [Stylonychia lemnae]